MQEGWGNLCPKDALGFLSVFPSTAYGDALHATDSERLRLKKKKKKEEGGNMFLANKPHGLLFLPEPHLVSLCLEMGDDRDGATCK